MILKNTTTQFLVSSAEQLVRPIQDPKTKFCKTRHFRLCVTTLVSQFHLWWPPSKKTKKRSSGSLCRNTSDQEERKGKNRSQMNLYSKKWICTNTASVHCTAQLDWKRVKGNMESMENIFQWLIVSNSKALMFASRHTNILHQKRDIYIYIYIRKKGKTYYFNYYLYSILWDLKIKPNYPLCINKTGGKRTNKELILF